MPNYGFVSPIRVKNGSTDFTIASSTGGLYHQGVVLPASTLISPLANITWATTGAQTLVNTTSVQTLENKTWGAGSVYSLETLVCSSGGVTPSTAVAYGITRVTANTTGGDFSTSPRLVSLASPIVGVEKTIVFESTAAAVNTLDVDLGIGVGVDGSTSNRYIAFSSLATLHQSVTLLGMTTALWAVKNVNSTVGQWGAATGIRSETAARTS